MFRDSSIEKKTFNFDFLNNRYPLQSQEKHDDIGTTEPTYGNNKSGSTFCHTRGKLIQAFCSYEMFESFFLSLQGVHEKKLKFSCVQLIHSAVYASYSSSLFSLLSKMSSICTHK